MLNPPLANTALAAPPAELNIRLLGLPSVAQRQSRLDIPRREVRALLYRLANRLEPVSREQLCFLFSRCSTLDFSHKYTFSNFYP